MRAVEYAECDRCAADGLVVAYLVQIVGQFVQSARDADVPMVPCESLLWSLVAAPMGLLNCIAIQLVLIESMERSGSLEAMCRCYSMWRSAKMIAANYIHHCMMIHP